MYEKSKKKKFCYRIKKWLVKKVTEENHPYIIYINQIWDLWNQNERREDNSRNLTVNWVNSNERVTLTKWVIAESKLNDGLWLCGLSQFPTLFLWHSGYQLIAWGGREMKCENKWNIDITADKQYVSYRVLDLSKY